MGKGLIQERLKILNELWILGIKAETSYVDNPKTARQMEAALENGIPLIIFLGENEVKDGVVKVKILNKHQEIYIKREELAQMV